MADTSSSPAARWSKSLLRLSMGSFLFVLLGTIGLFVYSMLARYEGAVLVMAATVMSLAYIGPASFALIFGWWLMRKGRPWWALLGTLASVAFIAPIVPGLFEAGMLNPLLLGEYAIIVSILFGLLANLVALHTSRGNDV
jgi:hypothetical protein